MISTQLLKKSPSDEQRIELIRLLGQSPNISSDHLDQLIQLLDSRNSMELQVAVLESLQQNGHRSIANQLLAKWESLSPAIQKQAVQTILTREMWTSDLLDRFEGGKLAKNTLDAYRRALARNPQLGQVWLNLAFAQMAQDDANGALASFDAALVGAARKAGTASMMSDGFAKCRAKPARALRLAASSPSRPLMAIAGTGHAAANSSPSRSGRVRSLTSTSIWLAARTARACCTLLAVSTVWPARRRLRLSTLSMRTSSSTSRMGAMGTAAKEVPSARTARL